MKLFLFHFSKDQSAVSSLEYALLASLIAVVVVAGVASAGSGLRLAFTLVKDQVVLAMK